ncbi:MAG: hypothetical protein KAS23_12450 [Anaerohalosphaera sp.]|nr:hypothetical protein [Anaerohalosphaera sp.]
MIDIHAHILPDIDDGPKDWVESEALCCAMVSDGITDVIATPHQLGRFGNESCQPIRQKVDELNQKLKDSSVALTVHAGAEVRLDERIESLLDEEKILTLAGSKYLLLELLPEIALDITPLIGRLLSREIIPIIAHVERYPYYINSSKSPDVLSEAGAYFQVTASSLVGTFGSSVQAVAWHFLRDGNVAVVASDAHDTDYRNPQMTRAYEMIQHNMGVELADILCCQNPRCILNSEPLITPDQTFSSTANTFFS